MGKKQYKLDELKMTLYRFETIDSDLNTDAKNSLRAISSRAEISRNRFSVWYDYSDLNANPSKVMLDFFDIGFRYSEWGSPRIYMRVPTGVIPDVFLLSGIAEFDDLLDNESYQVLEFYSTIEDEGNYTFYDEAEIDDILSSIKELRFQILKGDYRLFYLCWLNSYQEDNDFGRLPLISYNFGELNASLDHIINVLNLSDVPIKALDLLLQNEPSHPISITQQIPSDITYWVNSLSEIDKNKILVQLFEKGTITKYEALKLIGTIENVVEKPRFEKWLTLDMLEPYLKKSNEIIEKAYQAQELAREEKRKKEQVERLNQIYLKRATMWLDMEFEASKRTSSGYKKAAEIYKDLRDAYEFNDNFKVFKQKQDEFMIKHGTRRTLIQRIKEKTGLSNLD